MKIFFTVVRKFCLVALVAKASMLAYLRDLTQSQSNVIPAQEI